MVIIWSNFAKNNLRDYLRNSHRQKNNVSNYIKSLVNYVQNLIYFNSLGKVLYYYHSIEIRQLLYKQHRILYYISNQEIHILAILHTSQNLKTTLKFIKKFFY